MEVYKHEFFLPSRLGFSLEFTAPSTTMNLTEAMNHGIIAALVNDSDIKIRHDGKVYDIDVTDIHYALAAVRNEIIKNRKP